MRFIILLSLLWCFPGSAADLPYAVSAIPAGLFRHANAVKRFEDVRFEVKSIRQARFYRKVAYTILNEKGDDWADMSETYDRVLWGEPALEGTLYDARGQKIKSTKKTDFRDFSNVSEGTLAANDRVRSHNFYHKVYPYTIEYTIEQDYYATMFYPAWIPCPRTLLAVEQSRMTVILPEKETFRFKAINGAGGPVITTESGKSKYTWEISNFPALQGEYAAPFLTDIVPLVMMAPSRFYIQGYEGDMQNWKEYGLFVQSLKQDKVSLPPAMQQQVHKLVDGLPDVPAKVDALYRFMQENTRYISIQLGIGGWQPFPAAFVAEKRYGDCKALTNYMQALLKEAGI
ncbi:MAG TPA: DUF3857 domain-containing protein, partial [Lacibacter sp.]|nr:DUF3857 domain-containing protein [Lacibacter sp.]